MNYPEREVLAAALQVLIFRHGGSLFEMPASMTYGPLADRFKLDHAARSLTRGECYGGGDTGSAWANQVQWARKYLVDDGSVHHCAPHGIWRLTAKGVTLARILSTIPERTANSLRKIIQEKAMR
jgi:hypothetical protein